MVGPAKRENIISLRGLIQDKTKQNTPFIHSVYLFLTGYTHKLKFREVAHKKNIARTPTIPPETSV